MHTLSEISDCTFVLCTEKLSTKYVYLWFSNMDKPVKKVGYIMILENEVCLLIAILSSKRIPNQLYCNNSVQLRLTGKIKNTLR